MFTNVISTCCIDHFIMMTIIMYSKSPTYEPSSSNFQRYELASGSIRKPEPVPSTSGVSEIVACPLSPIADDPSALPSPTSSPSSSP